jgi:Transglycosylase-like domain
MPRRILLIAAPLCLVAIAAGTAFAQPFVKQHTKDAKLDNPHAVRPIAASPLGSMTYALGGVVDSVAAFVRDAELHDVALFVSGVQVAMAPPLNTAAPARTSAGSSGGGGFLDCVKQRESHGDYTVHNSGGSGASGAYQFMPSTWDSIAASSGRSDLVGVDPAAAAPSDQDAMAAQLYTEQGSAPWGGGC